MKLDTWIPRVVAVAIAVLVLLGWRNLVRADVEHLADTLHDRMLVPSSVSHGTPYAWAHCRRAPYGCRARVHRFAAYFVYIGERYEVDAYLLAAMAVVESRLHPWAVGPAGSRGILQVHPSHREARELDVFDPEARERCRRTLGACQFEVVALAARILRDALEACPDLRTALGAYNTGRCVETGYARRVLRTLRQLQGSRGAA